MIECAGIMYEEPTNCPPGDWWDYVDQDGWIEWDDECDQEKIPDGAAGVGSVN
jgi:hypothetical protein